MNSPQKLEQKIDSALGLMNQKIVDEIHESIVQRWSSLINEALGGIATEDDLQPVDGLKKLLSAMEASGLDASLKEAGVKWHSPQPSNHVITFSRNDIPIIQFNTAELNNSKQLGDALTALNSIANGNAPQASQVELTSLQKQVQAAREEQNKMVELAKQVTGDVDEDEDNVGM